jgi:hypothetical protein
MKRPRLDSAYLAMLVFLFIVLSLIVRKAAGQEDLSEFMEGGSFQTGISISEIGYWPVNVDELLENAGQDMYVPIGVNAFVMYTRDGMKVTAEINWNKSPSECESKLYRWTGDGFVCEPEEVPMHCFPVLENLPPPEITIHIGGKTVYEYQNGATITYQPGKWNYGSSNSIYESEERR